MQCVIKYRLFLHTFKQKIEDTIKIDNCFSYFDGEKNCSICNERDAINYIKVSHRLGDIEKLFKVSQEIYDSEYEELGGYFSKNIIILKS